MTEEEKVELRDMFAMIALPGLIGKTGAVYFVPQLVEDAYDIAEEMIAERQKRIDLDKPINPTHNESIH